MSNLLIKAHFYTDSSHDFSPIYNAVGTGQKASFDVFKDLLIEEELSAILSQQTKHYIKDSANIEVLPGDDDDDLDDEDDEIDLDEELEIETDEVDVESIEIDDEDPDDLVEDDDDLDDDDDIL